MKKFGLLMAVMGLFLSFCAKATPNNKPGDSEIVDTRTFCEEYPAADMCIHLKDYTEMEPEDAKLTVYSSQESITNQIASYTDMATYNSVIDLPVTKPAAVHLSLKGLTTDNAELDGIRYTPKYYLASTGEDKSPSAGNFGDFAKGESDLGVGAVMYMNYPSFYGNKAILAVLFTGKDGKKYYINLPRVRLIKNF